MAALYFLQSYVVTIFITINYLTNTMYLYHLYANRSIKVEVELWALSVRCSLFVPIPQTKAIPGGEGIVKIFFHALYQKNGV